MNFQTLLDQRSSAIMTKLVVDHLFGSQGPVTQSFSALPAPPDQSKTEWVSVLEFWCPKGSMEAAPPQDYILTSSVKLNMRNILRAIVSVNFPVLLQGPTSSGKTSMVEYLVRKPPFSCALCCV